MLIENLLVSCRRRDTGFNLLSGHNGLVVKRQADNAILNVGYQLPGYQQVAAVINNKGAEKALAGLKAADEEAEGRESSPLPLPVRPSL